jgi:predicted dehydrogenase
LLGAAREWRELADQAERHRGRKMSERGEEPKRDHPLNKMTREEAERLRALLRGTKAADLNDPFARQRVGRAIAQAIDRGPPRNR